MIEAAVAEGVSEEVAEWLLQRQNRCTQCNGTYRLEIHHRVPRGEYREITFKSFWEEQVHIYEETYQVVFAYILWGLHSVQNLVVLCHNCHSRITDGYAPWYWKYKKSFTCPQTGFNVPFRRPAFTLY